MGLLDLLKSRLKLSDTEAQGTGVVKLTDPGALADIAKSDESGEVRREAVHMLTDQAVLADIAKTDESATVVIEAINKLTDQVVLADVAKNAEDEWVRIVALDNLTDQALLADIALTDESVVNRKHAVDKLGSQTVLAGIAIRDNNEDVRYATVKKLTDQDMLAYVAKNDESKRIRYSAVKKLSDQVALASVAKNDKSLQVRSAAAQKIASQVELADDLDHSADEWMQEVSPDKQDESVMQAYGSSHEPQMNNEVTKDVDSGLMWQKENEDVKRNYLEAIEYCDNLQLDGHDNWRLPTIAEIEALYDEDSPDHHKLDFTEANCERYWSTTEFRDPSGESPVAYTYDFSSGDKTIDFKKNVYYVRAVRDM